MLLAGDRQVPNFICHTVLTVDADALPVSW
jgi:hypothetical protein